MTRRTSPLEVAAHIEGIAGDCAAAGGDRKRRDFWPLKAAQIHLERLALIDADTPAPVGGMTVFRHRPLHRQAIRWSPGDPADASTVIRLVVTEGMAWEVRDSVLHLTPDGQESFEVRPGQWLTLTPGGFWGAVDDDRLHGRYQEVRHP